MLAADRIVQDDLKLKERALHYLDITGQLASIKKECSTTHQRNEKQVPIYSFCICIDIQELCQIDAELTNMVSSHPQDAHTLFQEVCFTAAQTLSSIPDSVKSSQVHISLQLKYLPQLPCYILRPGDFFASKFTSRFYQFIGIVCSMSSLSKYTCCAKYTCPIPECSGSEENMYIRLHTAGAKETQTVRKDFHCFCCGTVLVEDVNSRSLGEKVVLKLAPKDSLSWNSTCPQNQQLITVYARDDLTPKVFLGGCFTVVGIPTVEYSAGAKISVAFEANNVLPVENISTLCISETIPERIQELHADRKCSLYSFTLSLAYLFASDIAPPGTFHKLKLHILLSLVQATEAENLLDLLAVGKDTHIIERLLIHAASLAEQSITTSRVTPLFGSVHKDQLTGTCNIEGGSLLLAHHGVCLLGNLDVWKKDDKERLRAATDSRNITFDIPRSVESGPLPAYTIPLESTLWGHVSSENSRGLHPDLFMTQSMNGSIKTLPQGFSMVVMCDNVDSTWDEYKEACLIHSTLATALNVTYPDSCPSISREDFRKFLQIASQRTATLTKPAQQLIKGYFVGSRRVRSSGPHGTPFNPGALKTLSSMAKSHAKLGLRNEATEGDATIAILLYEESITARFGYSSLNVHPSPHFRDGNVDAYLGHENDHCIQQFQQQLWRFCANHDPDFDLHRPED